MIIYYDLIYPPRGVRYFRRWRRVVVGGDRWFVVTARVGVASGANTAHAGGHPNFPSFEMVVPLLMNACARPTFRGKYVSRCGSAHATRAATRIATRIPCCAQRGVSPHTSSDVFIALSLVPGGESSPSRCTDGLRVPAREDGKRRAISIATGNAIHITTFTVATFSAIATHAAGCSPG